MHEPNPEEYGKFPFLFWLRRSRPVRFAWSVTHLLSELIFSLSQMKIEGFVHIRYAGVRDCRLRDVRVHADCICMGLNFCPT